MGSARIQVPSGLCQGWWACLVLCPVIAAASTCQYVGIPGRRPELNALVAVCPGGPGVSPSDKLACETHARLTYCKGTLCHSGRSVFAPGSDEISISRCEELCTHGFPGAPADLQKGKCKGFVLREPYSSVVKGKASCWLIPEGAKASKKWPDELHLHKSAIHGFGKKSSKKMFIKENCGCGTRYLQIARPPQRTELALISAKIENALLQSPPQPDGDLASSGQAQAENMTGRVPPVTPSVPSHGDELQALRQRADQLRDVLSRTAEAESFEGVYDYLPLHIPHRIYKGYFRLVPFGVMKLLSRAASYMTNAGGWHYWESPVRITSIYKKVDFSAVIYKCMDKSKPKAPPEHWYLVSRSQLEAHLLAAFGVKDMKKLQEDLSLQVALFSNMGCIGYKLGDDGYLYTPEGRSAASQKLDVFISPDSLSNVKSAPSSSAGCFENEEAALQVRERNVISDILAHVAQLDAEVPGTDQEGDDVEQLSLALGAPAQLLRNQLCQDLLVGPQAVLSKIQLVEKVIAHQKVLGAAWAAADGISKITGGVKTGVKAGWTWLKDKVKKGDLTTMTTVTNTTTPNIREEFPLSRSVLLKRTATLVEAMREIVIRIYAIKATEDEQMKLFCAKEMLEIVQEVGGIWPKISQNLAVRPDIVEDDYARSKLKETQSGNKNRGREATLEYLKEADPKLDLGGTHGNVSILDFMSHEKFLSAGSVGQVDVFVLKRASLQASSLASAFLLKHVPYDWKGDKAKFIVKTVFKDTEEQYMGDFRLLEIFFTKLKKYLPRGISMIWDVLKNMKTSIFDEFDLRKEARFTMRGRALLREYSSSYLKSKGIRATAPVGLETSSKYVMIQTVAQGLPLKSYLERVKGQWDAIAAWRQDIYSSILGVFGYTSIRHGFFQADPHPGNWFWHHESRTLTLIDWGGVEDWTQKDDLKSAHCTLARLYSVMGKLVKGWSACEAVVLESEALPEISGEYHRSGISIYSAADGETSLMMGHTYALSYKHTKRPLSLSFDGIHWQVSVERPLEAQPFQALLRMLPRTGGVANATLAPAPDQSFFGLAQVGRVKGQLEKTEWERLNAKGSVVDKVQIWAGPADAESCGAGLTRTQAYQAAANNLQIKLKTGCRKFMFVDTSSDPALKDQLRTDRMALVCLKEEDKGKLVGRVGVPARNYELVGTLEDPRALRIPLTSKGGKADRSSDRQGKSRMSSASPSTQGEVDVITLPLLGEEAAAHLPVEAPGASASGSLALTDEGVGRLIAADLVGAESKADGGADTTSSAPAAVLAAEPSTRRAIYEQAQRAYAMATSLFDSDVAEVALQALKGRQSLALFSAGAMPEEYTLFARCVVVFHGMIGDVLRDNFLRLVPMRNLQWLLQRHGDGFFETWHAYADEYIHEAQGSCPAGPWEALSAEPSAVEGENLLPSTYAEPQSNSLLEMDGRPSSGFIGRGVAMWARLQELRRHGLDDAESSEGGWPSADE